MNNGSLNHVTELGGFWRWALLAMIAGMALFIPTKVDAGIDPRIICRPCETRDDCGDIADFCINYGPRAGCGMACFEQEDCPAGTQCRTLPDFPGFNNCVDVANSCATYPLYECGASGHCPDGHACVDGHCVLDLGALGEECEVDGDCESGLCSNTYRGLRCTQPCDWLIPVGSCPDGFFCSERDRCGDGICVSGTLETGVIGDNCVLDTDCAGAFCSLIPSLNEAICTQPCDPAAPTCPAEMSCEGRDVGCGSCVPNCTARSDCPAGMGCINGHCQNLLATGSLCSVDEQCASGLCQDGICTAGGGEDTGPGVDGGDGTTFATDCSCTASGRRLVWRGFPLPLLLVLLPALGLLRRRRSPIP